MKGLLFKGAKRRVFAFMAAIALSFSLIGVVPARRVRAAGVLTIINSDFSVAPYDNGAGWTPGFSDWPEEGDKKTSIKQDKEMYNFYSPGKNVTASFSQTLTNVPAGTYTFTLKAMGADASVWLSFGNNAGSEVALTGWKDSADDYDTITLECEIEDAGDYTLLIQAEITNNYGYGYLKSIEYSYQASDAYSITSISSDEFKIGSTDSIVISTNAPINKISGVKVGTSSLDASNYSVAADGDTASKITLSNDYLKDLAAGDYTYTVSFADKTTDSKTISVVYLKNGGFGKTTGVNVDDWTIKEFYGYTDAYASNNKSPLLKINNETANAVGASFSQNAYLAKGTYEISFKYDGNAGIETPGLSLYINNKKIKELEAANGWDDWKTVTQKFNIDADAGDVAIAVSGDVAAWYWGSFDDFSIEKVEDDPNAVSVDSASYIVTGDGKEYEKGYSKTVIPSMEVDSLNDNIDSIKIGDKTLVDGTDYESSSNKAGTGTVITFKTTYLDGLAIGTYTVDFFFKDTDKKASGTFKVSERAPGLLNGDFENSKYWELSNIENKKEPFKITKDDNGGANKTTYLDIYTTDKTNSSEIKQTFKAEESGEFVVSYSYLGSSGDTGYAMYINDTKIGTLSGNGWGTDGGWSKTTTSKFTLEKDKEVTFKIVGISAEGAYFKVDDIKIEKYVPKDREFDYDTTIATDAPVKTEELYVEKLDLANGFITGADISSYASIIASGATFKDADENVLSNQGFFDLLADSGVNYVRIRVWVNPKDENNNYYGGGNCNVATAIKLGQYATDAGMRVLIDFHYSDFWTDPGKQNAPKAWKNLSLTEKAATLKQWTIDSLTAIIGAGVDVGMVQIGNETTTGFCGETNMANMCTLFKAGSEGVQAVETAKNTKIMMAIHLTNPNNKDFSAYAQELEDNGVVYDVFATSFYPYWHGTLDNLYNKLSAVATTYDKYVMVAETSYVRTLEDGDGWENTETQKKYDDGTDVFPYDISEQGQVLHIRNVIKTVSSIEGGIGVFWWEPAWIPVENWADADDQDAVLASNKAKWETYGSGWAASAAAEYDPNVGSWYGGSAVDNESWFDFDGTALESLKVYNMVRFGTTTEDYTLGAIDAEYAFVEGEEYELPTQIEVRMASGKTSKADVTWNMDQVKEAVKQGRGTYQIDGTYTYDGVEYEDMATLNLTIKPVNLLTNGSFEDGKGEGWNFDLTHTTGIENVEKPDGVKEEDSHDGKYTFHFYSTTPQSFEVTQTLTLEPGAYAFNGFFQGLAGVEGEIFAIVGDEEYVASYTLNGWVDWQNLEISKIIVTEKTEVTVGFRSSYAAEAWGTCDDFTLYRMGDIFTVTFENNGYGTAPEALIVVEGETIDEPDKLVADKKDQVEFTGWYTDKECKNKFDFDTKITKDITLYAGWKDITEEEVPEDDTSDANIIYTFENDSIEWTSGDGDLLVTVHRNINDSETINHFLGAKVDGKQLSEEDYTAVSGSLKLTLKSSYLETLEAGEHILSIVFDDGTIESKFVINGKAADAEVVPAETGNGDAASGAADSPKTGDDTPVSAIMLVLLISAAGITYILGLKRKKEQ